MLRSGRPADDAAAHGVCPVPRVGASCVGVHGPSVRTDKTLVYIHGQLIHYDIQGSPRCRGRGRVHITKPLDLD